MAVYINTRSHLHPLVSSSTTQQYLKASSPSKKYFLRQYQSSDQKTPQIHQNENRHHLRHPPRSRNRCPHRSRSRSQQCINSRKARHRDRLFDRLHGGPEWPKRQNIFRHPGELFPTRPSSSERDIKPEKNELDVANYLPSLCSTTRPAPKATAAHTQPPTIYARPSTAHGVSGRAPLSHARSLRA